MGSSGGTISNAYWDTGTSGQPSSGGGTGKATAQLQGSLPSGFDGSVWATGPGLYPYLKSFFPNGAQAVSGIADGGDGTALAFSTAGTNTVSVDAGGALVGQTNINSANGYYYVLMPAGSIANGADLLVSLPTDASTGAVNAATLATSTYTSGTPGQGGINLYGSFLSERTGATTLSAAPSLASVQTAANTVAGTDSTASAIVNAITAPGYLTTGSSFTVDQSYSGSGFLVTTGTSDPITVSNDVTISDGGALALLSGGALAIDAAVTAKGSTSVSLAYDSASATNLSFGLTSTGFTGSLGFANADGSTAIFQPGRQSVDQRHSYTLIYTMDQFDAIDATSAVDGSTITGYGPGLQGHYALASSLDAASGTSYTDALVGTGSTQSSTTEFTGSFTGLGHTVSNLKVDTGSSSYAGLFGYVSGTLRDIGVVGGSVKGGSYVGGLAGYISGTISNAYATGAVTAASGSYYAGGLVGFQDGGTISEAYATGALSGGGSDVGGLVGESYGTIDDAYATGAISGGGANLGGLVGASLGTISNAYATGAVNGGSALGVGGLVGYQYSGTISSAYATGAVSGSGSDVGGLVGGSGSTISNAYWDTATSGQSSSGGGTAQTTATFQADSLPPLASTVRYGARGRAFIPISRASSPMAPRRSPARPIRMPGPTPRPPMRAAR